jgi:hypothetical protein
MTFEGTIDVATADQVFHSLHSNMTFERFMTAYNNFIPPYDRKICNNLNMEVLGHFAQVFKFRGTTLEACRRELSGYFREYWQYFYAGTLEDIYSKMCQARDNYNAGHPYTYQYVNWIPMYGGVLQPNTLDPHGQEKQFMKHNKIPYPLTNKVPTTGEQEDDGGMPTMMTDGTF